MAGIGIRSAFSQCPFQIQIFDSAGAIGTATGFFYDLDGETFLITNWHNISGKNFVTKKCLDPNLRTPEYIEVQFASWIPGSGMARWLPSNKVQRVEIYQGFEPLWFEHPELGSSCDIIALPLSRPADCPEFMHDAANLVTTDNIPLKPGNTVFIIGFPMGLSIGPGLPLWKSGYIASEPFFDISTGDTSNFLPAIFIDAQTRQGMSGSPVYASYSGSWDNSDPYSDLAGLGIHQFVKRTDVVLASTGIEFIGCYSGRAFGKANEAALGLCWRKEAIEHICGNRTPGQYPHPELLNSR